MQLQSSLVKRGGVTQPYWTGGTSKISANTHSGGLNVRFKLNSKGGGETDILVQIGKEDLVEIIAQLAKDHPNELAVALADASKEAIERVMSQKGGGNLSAVA